MIPESLRSSRQSLSDAVKQASLASRIRWDGIADAFLHPLEQLLGKKRYLLSDDSPSSLDCVAFAYLALALIPALPEPWLATSMSRYPTLCAYVHALNQRFWGGFINGAIPKTWSGDEAAGSTPSQKQESHHPASLPWKKSRHDGSSIPAVLAGRSGALLDYTLGAIPVLGGYWKRRTISPPPPQADGVSRINATSRDDDGHDSDLHIRPGSVVTGTALAAIGGLFFYHGVYKPVVRSR